FPLTPGQIAQQDVVVLMGVPATALDAPQWAAVEALLRREAKSVILVAGDAHVSAGYGAAPVPSDLLPYDPKTVRPAWRVWPGEKPAYHFLPDPQAEPLAALRLADSAEQGL